MGSEADLTLLQGAWNIVSLEVDGNSVPKMFFSGSQIVIDGTRFKTKAMGATYEGTVTIDESTSPKRLTIAFDLGPEKGNSSYGIYELNGNDWRLCLTIRGGSFPAEFRTSGGSGLALESLVRA
ncbi:MAG: TIGR03067 domain-containing protein [Candidatus Zixiibacteriota bacterium]